MGTVEYVWLAICCAWGACGLAGLFVGAARNHCGLGAFLGLLLGQFGAAALLIHGDAFAALLHHFLHDFGDEQIIIRRSLAGACFNVAVLNRGLDEPYGRGFWLISALHGGHQRGCNIVANHDLLSIKKERMAHSWGKPFLID
jgi:hypothetical protein